MTETTTDLVNYADSAHNRSLNAPFPVPFLDANWARASHRYSVDLRTRTYTEPVPLKHGKLATK